MSGSWQFRPARPEDAPEIIRIRNAAADRLTARFGPGHWSAHGPAAGSLREPRGGRRFVAADGGEVVATLTLGTRKPWAIDRAYFSDVRRPLYLTDLVVDPARQGTGIGRRCVEEAVRAGREWPGDAIFLDAYDAPAGAGEFYRRAGFREVGRKSYRGVPLIYLERLLP